MVLHSYKLTRFSNQVTIPCVTHVVLHSYKLTRFSNYPRAERIITAVLHSYKLTRFSNDQDLVYLLVEFYTLTNLQGSQTPGVMSDSWMMFYTLTNLQGSQTPSDTSCVSSLFYTLTNLQGSQTSNEIITEPKHTGICVSHLVMYKTQIFIYQLIIFTFQTFTLASLNQQQIYFTIKRCFVQFL